MSGIADRLFDIVSVLDFNDVASDYEQHTDWTQRFGDVEPFPEHLCGKFSMSQAEQKWVVLDALCRQADKEGDSPDFYGHYLIEALSGNGFAPSFEDYLLSKCEMAWEDAHVQTLSAASATFRSRPGAAPNN